MTQRLLYLMICICCSVGMLSPAFAQSKGGRWQFENNGFDTANWDGMENDGTLQSAASFSSAEPLIEGTAYLLVDSTAVYDYFLVPDSPDLDFTDENIGISAWIYPYFVGGDVHWILNKGDQYPNPKSTNYSLRLSSTSNLEFLIRDASNQAQPVASSFAIPRNQWTFVAIFYDYAAGKIYMWNDPASAAVDTLDYTHSFFANDAPLAIGSWFRSAPSSPSIKDFEGRIDDVRIGTTIEEILSTGTQVEHQSEELRPSQFSLHQNYPNPFNPLTVLSFILPRKGHVTLRVYSLRGQEVAELINVELNAGSHSVTFDGTDLASGIYLYRLATEFSTLTRKMILTK